MPTRSRARRVAVGLALLLLLWIGWDLWGPHHSDLSDFDATEVARLETAMWRSYYERHEVRLFMELTELLRTQYHVPLFRSNILAYSAAKAAFIFKDGKQRADYERALPAIVNYYQGIRSISETPFDPSEVSRLELEWWIIHREREKYGVDALTRSLAELQAAVFHLPPERFMEHSRLRAEAMVLRDTRWETGHMNDSDWEAIDLLLQRSWQDLWKQLRQ
jgi:hypothetical protein